MKTISKKTILLLYAIAFYSCGVSQNYEIKYNDVEPTERQKTVMDEIKKENEIMLFFDGGFNEDKITIIVNGKERYKDTMSTDNRIGNAKSYTFYDTDKKVKILINESPATASVLANGN